MGYLAEPKNIDLVVAPSVLTEDTKNKIAEAIAQYHKTGKKLHRFSKEASNKAGEYARLVK